MRQIGIDLGSSTVKIIILSDSEVERQWIEPHYGNIADTLVLGLQECGVADGTELCSVTGGNAYFLKDILPQSCLTDEIPAITEGVRTLVPNAACIMEIGSQSSRFITDLNSPAPRFSVSGHCAGGTGSFFEDQMSRLGMRIEDYSREVEKATSIPRLSGRCAVFAKTDIIHRQQEGVTIPDILNGLCYAMIRNYKAVIIKNLPVRKPVVFCGGVACNSGVAKAIRDTFGLSKEDLIIPKDFRYTAAIGAAKDAAAAVDFASFCESLANVKPAVAGVSDPLVLRLGTELHEPAASGVIPEEGCALGIDIGSTSTDLVLVSPSGELIDYQYLRTAGNPEKAVRNGLAAIQEKYGNITFQSVGVTGSGRTRIGRMIGADSIKDEITAQAKCASFWNPEADTVFEIGGQDSKYISLRDGEVVDFMMNKICAAGTGSFIEEQAARMDIPLEKFGEMALASRAPADLGERCTVFMETSIASLEGADTPQEDIAAGLCQSVVRNYLHRVVGNKPVGQHIVLQGGVDYNPGIVAAFQQAYGERITVSPCFSISGAFGVAMLALEHQEKGKPSHFHGFTETDIEEKPVLTAEIQKNIELYQSQRTYLMGDYDGTIDPNKKTVGIPYVLVIHRMFPMVYHFFTELGFNVLLSTPTNEDTIRRSQLSAEGETCYPVKLIYGHMLELVERGVDYLFLPRIHTMNHEGAGVKRSYGCVYMQSAPTNIARSLKLEDKGIHVLSPVVDMEIGPRAMASSMINVGISLGIPRPKVMKALASGARAFTAYGQQMEKQGQDLLRDLKPEDKVLVLMTRPYGMNDPVLNMGIPELLLERGYKVITNENLPGHDVHIDKDYPNMYWPFGQHILGGAELVASHPNLYAVYLTNHGCGPDSMLNHLVAEVMGDKPYLQIEVDEHFSKVGVITRVEAFLNSLENQSIREAGDISWMTEKKKKAPLPLRMIQKKLKKNVKSPNTTEEITNRPLFLPDFGLYSDYLKMYLEQNGKYSAVKITRITPELLHRGRSETRAKEYYPFAALAGTALSAATECQDPADLLIPSDRGAEAEGIYPLAVRSALRRNGVQNLRVVSPILEEILINSNDPDLLFGALLTGDLFYSAPSEFREKFAPKEIPTFEKLLELAENIGKIPVEGRKILVVGDPMCMTSLDEGVLEQLVEEGNVLLRTPLSESICFLMGDSPDIPSVQVQNYANRLGEIHRRLGERSAFAENWNSLNECADASLPSLNGGNARYRWAKTVLAKDVSAVLSLEPRYENVSMVLSMSGIQEACPVPYYEVMLDGDWDETAASQLRSFLHYC